MGWRKIVLGRGRRFDAGEVGALIGGALGENVVGGIFIINGNEMGIWGENCRGSSDW